MKQLEIHLDVDVDGDGKYDIKTVPAVLPLNNPALAQAASALVAAADLADAKPGDGEANIQSQVTVPLPGFLRILGGIFGIRGVKLNFQVGLKVVDAPDAPAEPTPA